MLNIWIGMHHFAILYIAALTISLFSFEATAELTEEKPVKTQTKEVYEQPVFLLRSVYQPKMDTFKPSELEDKLQLAASGQAPETEYVLGFMYENGYGVARDAKKAERWYEEAAKAGYVDAMVALGQLNKAMSKEEDAFSSITAAIKWFHAAAKEKNPHAWYELGLLYEFGDGLFKNDEKAFQAYQVAAEGNIANALTKLGLFYQEGRVVEKDIQKAAEYYKRSLELNTDPSVKLYIGALLGSVYAEVAATKENPEEAFKWLLLAGESNDVKSQIAIAKAYLNGTGVWQDYKEAIKWYNRAAANESVEAMIDLGYVYNNGLGVERDYVAAREWYIKAAERGSAEAAWNVGGFYFSGLGVEKNLLEADKWFKRSKILEQKAAEDARRAKANKLKPEKKQPQKQ